MKTLVEYAKENRIHYRTTWNAYKAGKIPGAFKNEFGKILIPDEPNKTEYVVCYARVSSSINKNDLEAQAKRRSYLSPGDFLADKNLSGNGSLFSLWILQQGQRRFS